MLANNEEKENLMRQEYWEIGCTREVREEVNRARRLAGALYRIDGTVLINRNIFDAFLENFHESTKGIGKRGLSKAERAKREAEE
jgi:hypothetical protein